LLFEINQDKDHEHEDAAKKSVVGKNYAIEIY